MSGVLAGSTVSGIYFYMLVLLVVVVSNGAGTNINFESESTMTRLCSISTLMSSLARLS